MKKGLFVTFLSMITIAAALAEPTERVKKANQQQKQIMETCLGFAHQSALFTEISLLGFTKAKVIELYACDFDDRWYNPYTYIWYCGRVEVGGIVREFQDLVQYYRGFRLIDRFQSAAPGTFTKTLNKWERAIRVYRPLGAQRQIEEYEVCHSF